MLSYEPIDLETIIKRKKAFFRAVRPLTAWQTAKMMGRLTLGIDWRGCKKGYIADQWANGQSYPELNALTIEDINAGVTAHLQEMRHG